MPISTTSPFASSSVPTTMPTIAPTTSSTSSPNVSPTPAITSVQTRATTVAPTSAPTTTSTANPINLDDQVACSCSCKNGYTGPRCEIPPAQQCTVIDDCNGRGFASGTRPNCNCDCVCWHGDSCASARR